mgnify:FL=1
MNIYFKGYIHAVAAMLTDFDTQVTIGHMTFHDFQCPGLLGWCFNVPTEENNEEGR